ncbi:hypothetical protein HMPREF9013_0406 [Bulleidia extructa W1219]|uniref:Uncharacterized protein n=1 Tax=Bulleidia extructa W1219 TaxID=679192 RepID=D2MQ59_9FIRM|nr:hypothetical protein [Bulleidia extructa]EFC05128.1 hypothetical protein HMPREF9013_0406 [Bulleidia extructa W1219]
MKLGIQALGIQRKYLYKGIQYYVQYLFRRKRLNDKYLDELQQEDIKKICLMASKRAYQLIVGVGMIYLFAFMFIIASIISTPVQNQTVFTRWYINTIQSVFMLVNRNQGSAIGTILLTGIKLLPIAIIDVTPLFIIISLIINWSLEKELKKITH